MTDTDKLRTAGEALYGACWQSDLARALGVSVRTVQRWAAGRTEPPHGVWSDLAGLCRSRGRTLVEIARHLGRQPAP